MISEINITIADNESRITYTLEPKDIVCEDDIIQLVPKEI